MKHFKLGDTLVRTKQTPLNEDSEGSNYHKEIAIGAKVQYMGKSDCYAQGAIYIGGAEFTQCAEDFDLVPEDQSRPSGTLLSRITSILSHRQGITQQAEAIQALVLEVAVEAYNQGYDDAAIEWPRDYYTYLQTLTDGK